jgi:hypothetical protein
MIAYAIILDIRPVEFAPADSLNRLQHGTTRMAAAADVVNLAGSRGLEDLPKGIDCVSSSLVSRIVAGAVRCGKVVKASVAVRITVEYQHIF